MGDLDNNLVTVRVFPPSARAKPGAQLCVCSMTNPPTLDEANGRIGSSFRLTTNLLPITLLVQPRPDFFHTALHGSDISEVTDYHSTVKFKIVYDGGQWITPGHSSDLWLMSICVAVIVDICLLVGSLKDVRHD
jgi:hypothetical protein